MKKMQAYLHLRDFKNGKINAEKCLDSFPAGSELWVAFMQYYLLLAMHTGNYINAVAIYNRATAHKKFRKLPTATLQKWKIFEVYVNLLVETEGKNNPVLAAQSKKQFDLKRFLGQTLVYPRNQRFMTTHMVVGQFILQLEKRRLTEAADLVDRLRNFANRQLKREEHFRTIQFIRLLQQLERADFDPERMSNQEKYLEFLKEQPFRYHGHDDDLEIIPYEQLWKLILQTVTKTAMAPR